MTEIKPLKLLTTTSELRRVVEQINLTLSDINDNFTQDTTDINNLKAIAFNIDDILVNKDGDVLTNSDGEVLLA